VKGGLENYYLKVTCSRENRNAIVDLYCQNTWG